MTAGRALLIQTGHTKVGQANFTFQRASGLTKQQINELLRPVLEIHQRTDRVTDSRRTSFSDSLAFCGEGPVRGTADPLSSDCDRRLAPEGNYSDQP